MIAVKLNKINKSFNKKEVLKDFSLEIKSGEMVAITGSSGCGKTTSLNIMGLIEKADSGTVDIFDIKNALPNTKKSHKAIREYIGYLFQNYALIDNETVEQNLEIGLRYVKKANHKKLIKTALEAVGLENFEKRKIFELSGGEQQRIAIARVMLKPSKLILADEPTGSLDSVNRKLVMDLLIKLNEMGKTVIIVTHDDYIANRCTRVVKIY